MAERIQDTKVTETVAAWLPRFIVSGLDFGQIEDTISRIENWQEWCLEWGSAAKQYEVLARQAEDEGLQVTAAHAWRQAFRCWHFAKFVFGDVEDDAKAANERAVSCYARGAWALDPAAWKVSIPYDTHAIPAYLRQPRIPAPYAPLVVMIPGLDSVKEEMEVQAGFLLERGLATLAIDGPGQGELEAHLPLTLQYEAVIGACLDWAAAQSGLRVDRVGVFGRSLGGHYACRAAAFDVRVRATVDLSGPYDMAAGWETRREVSRLTFQRRSGARDGEEALALAREFSLVGVTDKIASPLLVVHGLRDGLVTREAAERIASEAQCAELRVFEDGLHGLTNYPFESGSFMADWLVRKLT